MHTITIIQRPLTAQEQELVNTGFDDLSREAGIALEHTERLSVVAMHDNSLVGCATGWAHKNGADYSGWFHLTDLFVTKAFRNKGLGSDLLNALENHIKTIGINKIWLWTSGEPTLRFYDRHGYQQFTALEDWYSDGSSRIGLRKHITQP